MQIIMKFNLSKEMILFVNLLRNTILRTIILIFMIPILFWKTENIFGVYAA